MENAAPIVDEPQPLPVPQMLAERILYAFVVTILPIISFALSNVLKPEWQSGKTSDYVVLLFLPQAAWFFFPFLIYSVVSTLLLLFAPRRFAAHFVVRFGVYTGFLLALQYAILVAGTDFAIVSAVAAAFLVACRLIFWKTQSRKIWIALIFVLVLGGLLIAGITNSFAQAPFFVVIAILVASPFLCLVIAGFIAFKLIRHYEKGFSFPLWPAAGVLGWLALYGVAWRFSILQAVEIYHSLPVAPPDCYIATASARGHQRLVGSWSVATPRGTMMVTRQLQLLKCAELALMVLAPALHRFIRANYDVVGKALARRLNNPFLADLAYLMLKPLEWAARLVLKMFVPEINQYMGKLYAIPD